VHACVAVGVHKSEEDTMNRQLNTRRAWRRSPRQQRQSDHIATHRRDEHRTLSAVFGESTVRQWRGW
jgi:hypothetical protein